MSTDLNRRGLLRGLVAPLTEDPPPDPVSPEEADADSGPGDFFASFESAYALIDECRPFLAEEARRLGLDTTNMSDLDVVRVLFSPEKGPASAASDSPRPDDDGTAPGRGP